MQAIKGIKVREVIQVPQDCLAHKVPKVMLDNWGDEEKRVTVEHLGSREREEAPDHKHKVRSLCHLNIHDIKVILYVVCLCCTNYISGLAGEKGAKGDNGELCPATQHQVTQSFLSCTYYRSLLWWWEHIHSLGKKHM